MKVKQLEVDNQLSFYIKELIIYNLVIYTELQ